MTWILTRSGKHFDFVDPQPDQIHIVDIAWGLSKECRFAGQCMGFYSVAQHSIHVSEIVPAELALEALLHDASEAYCKDIPMPLKALLPDYKAIEQRVDRAIRAAFNLSEVCSPEVKRADIILLATERRDLMPFDPEPWAILQDVTPLQKPIRPMSIPRALDCFMHNYTDLCAMAAAQ